MGDVLPPTALLSWNVDLSVCDLDKELRVFKAKHTAQFSAQVKGQSHQHTQSVPELVSCCLETTLRRFLQGFHVSEYDLNMCPT